jgi:hypothetical protein
VAKIKPAPIFSLTDYIYPGPHLDKNGKIDDRIWFAILINRDVDNLNDTYLMFPYGGSEEDIAEITAENTSPWIG